MARPRKIIPEIIGRRIQQLSRAKNGARAISEIIRSEFPGPQYSYSHTHIQKYLNDHASDLVNPVARQVTNQLPISRMPNLAGTSLPSSAIPQLPESTPAQSWAVDTSTDEEDNSSYSDWAGLIYDATSPFQPVFPNSSTPATQNEDLSSMMLGAMIDVTKAIPGIGINSWKNRMLSDIWKKFNPDPTPEVQQFDYQSLKEKIEGSIARHGAHIKEQEALKEKREQEHAKYDEEMQKKIETLLKQVDSNLGDRQIEKPLAETLVPTVTQSKGSPSTDLSRPGENHMILEAGNTSGSDGKQNSIESAAIADGEPLQVKTFGSDGGSKNLSSDRGSDIQSPLPDTTTGLERPDDKKNLSIVEKNQTGSQPPSESGSVITGIVAPVDISQKAAPELTDRPELPLTAPPLNVTPAHIRPLSSSNNEDQKSNESLTDKSNIQETTFSCGPKDELGTPEITFQKAQAGPNRNLVGAAVVIVGLGVAALYLFNPQARQWIFKQYVRIFGKASPASTSDEESIQVSYASARGYARVNDPHSVALF